jgi:CHAD domain-containing protein
VAARIAVKKWRYTLECIRAVQPDHPQKPKRLRDLQQSLGAIRDAATLRDFLVLEARRLDRKEMAEYARVLRRAIAEIEDERLSAVAEFQKTAAAFELSGGLGSG